MGVGYDANVGVLVTVSNYEHIPRFNWCITVRSVSVHVTGHIYL